METKRTLENSEFFTNASPFETLCGKVASYEAKVFPNKSMHELISCALSRFSTWRICSREQANSECDWLVMSSVFVASQSSCFFLCSREQIRLVENRLKVVLNSGVSSFS